MELRKVRINNFRSITYAEIDFVPRCRILIGINESGKSNVLKAMALLDPSVKVTNDDLREGKPDEDPVTDGFIHFVFSLAQTDRNEAMEYLEDEVSGDITKPIVLIGEEKLTLAKYLDTLPDTLYRVLLKNKTRGWTYWEHKKGTVIDGWQKPSKKAISAAAEPGASEALKSLADVSLVHVPTSDLPFDLTSKTEYFEKLTLADLHKIVNSAIHLAVETLLPDCVFWQYKESNLLPASIETATFFADPETCIPMKHMFLMAGYPDINAAFNLNKDRPNGIRNMLNRVSRLATEHMHKVWEDYKDLKLRLDENGDKIDAFVEDTFNTFSFGRRSDGFKRFITFLLQVSAKAKADDMKDILYLHDEPEISLHPSGARYLRDELIRISANNYVVYSTHSTFMIDNEDIGRHLIVKKEDEVTYLLPVDHSNILEEEVLYNALGISIFEDLKPKNIIFEGWRDKKLFDYALKHLPNEKKDLKKKFSGIGFCFAKGVKDIARVSPMLELANRHFIIISDSDDPAREQQKNYKGDAKWLRYDQLLNDKSIITAEDFLKATAFKSAIEGILERNPTWIAFPYELLEGAGKLSAIEDWLQGNGQGKEERKAIINEIKSTIYNNLKPSYLEHSYFSVLEAAYKELDDACPTDENDVGTTTTI